MDVALPLAHRDEVHLLQYMHTGEVNRDYKLRPQNMIDSNFSFFLFSQFNCKDFAKVKIMGKIGKTSMGKKDLSIQGLWEEEGEAFIDSSLIFPDGRLLKGRKGDFSV